MSRNENMYINIIKQTTNAQELHTAARVHAVFPQMYGKVSFSSQHDESKSNLLRVCFRGGWDL